MKIPSKLTKLAGRIKIPQKVTRFGGRLLMRFKNNSPEICLVSGIVIGGVAIVKVGVNTWKNKELISGDVESIVTYREYDAALEAEAHPDHPLITEDERKRELSQAYKTLWKDVFKTYWFPTMLFITSTGLVIGGHSMLRKHLSAALATNAMLAETLQKYRQRVIDEYGAEKDQEFMHGVKMLTSVDPETGETYQKADISKDYGCSMYARWWDEGEFDSTISAWKWRNHHYRENNIENQRQLKFLQCSANDRLNSRGWMKLNEVYTMLDLPCTEEGEYVGWVKGSGHDDYIDFSVFPDFQNGRRQLPVNKLFCDEYNPQNQALLDFNVDGDITYIFKDIYEYDNRSAIACTKRRIEGR